MKTITLKELNLINWSGITARYKMNKGRNVFSGKNGAGKTRLANAESWIHTGKNLEGSTKNEVKSLDGQAVETKGFHAAFAHYDIDGKSVMIGRSLQEKWTKKRGELEETRTGNDIAYYTGAMCADHPQVEKLTAKNFQALIDSEFGADYQKAAQINYLSSLHWKELREFLTGLCPVDQDSIISEISDFSGMLDGKTPEERKAIAEERAKVLKTKFSDNESAIKERKADLKTAGEMTLKQAETNIEHERQEIGKIQCKLDQLKQGSNPEQLQKLQQLNAELSVTINAFETRKQQAVDAENQRQRDIKNTEHEIKLQTEDLNDHKEKLESLRLDWQKIAAQKKAIRESEAEEISEICETCGQVLPADVLNKLKESFMSDRAKKLEVENGRLEKNAQAGKECKAEIARIQGLIDGEKNKFQFLVDVKSNPIINLSAESLPDVINIRKQIFKLKVSESGNDPEIKRLESELEALNVRLTNAQNQRAKVESLEESKNRLKELEADRKKLSAENDKIQTFLALYDQYIQAYADAVQGPVNELIPGVKFKMFEMSEMNKQIPACVICNDDWKPYETMLSTGERIGVDLACVAFMQQHLNISAPVWIDERQSYTGKIPLDCQFFELVTREDVETLTKEV